ncbi:MAG: selenocysteine-specific translation elongation factor [Dehalococcoidia bacterium]
MYVVGTSGHVDHGKSTLVRALTGIDPDRLREEKERGLTIDLGFAWLTLPSGREVSIVDVPGHERFIKNMLAGAGGVDVALLIVAADEGPMPQTREHLAILDLLDVPNGIVVITKCDMVEPDYVDLVEAEVEDVLRDSRLRGAPVVRTAATTGLGLPELLRTIDQVLEATPQKRDLGRPRLPIDRSFTIQGFGTVVTGTLVDGSLEVGQEVEIQPGRVKARVRGLQRHKTKLQRLEPGTRAAVNLSGIHAEDVARGMVLAPPGGLSEVHAVDVRLRATKLLAHPLSHDAGITFLSATAESEAKLRLLDRDALLPGEECWAQVVLDSSVAVARGDHCIIRTSNDTVAGGVIVAVNPRRHRRNHIETIEALHRQLEGSPRERLVDLLFSAPLDAVAAAKRLTVEAPAFEAAVAEAEAAGELAKAGARLYSTVWLDAAAARVAEAATAFLAANPLRASAPREHVRSTARVEAADLETVVAEGVRRGRLAPPVAGGVAPLGYTVELSPKQQDQVARLKRALQAGGYAPPTDALPDAPLLAFLVERGDVVDTGAGVVFDPTVFEEMHAKARAHAEQSGSITLAEVRDLFGTSRKYAQAFLEHLDALKATRRVGDARVFRVTGEGPR